MDRMENAKKAAALKAVEEVMPGMTIGLGTGSTAYYAIEAIGHKIQEGWALQAVASSIRSEELARSFGIPIIGFSSSTTIDLYIDGADAIDEKGNLIKGGGGALTREKILASNSKKFIVIVDESKMVKELAQMPVPVEILVFAYPLTLRRLESLGCSAVLREKDGEVFRSDNGNYIADCRFEKGIGDVAALNMAVNALPGVVESGLFEEGLAQSIFAGAEDGSVRCVK